MVVDHKRKTSPAGKPYTNRPAVTLCLIAPGDCHLPIGCTIVTPYDFFSKCSVARYGCYCSSQSCASNERAAGRPPAPAAFSPMYLPVNTSLSGIELGMGGFAGNQLSDEMLPDVKHRGCLAVSSPFFPRIIQDGEDVAIGLVILL